MFGVWACRMFGIKIDISQTLKTMSQDSGTACATTWSPSLAFSKSEWSNCDLALCFQKEPVFLVSSFSPCLWKKYITYNTFLNENLLNKWTTFDENLWRTTVLSIPKAIRDEVGDAARPLALDTRFWSWDLLKDAAWPKNSSQTKKKHIFKEVISPFLSPACCLYLLLSGWIGPAQQMDISSRSKLRKFGQMKAKLAKQRNDHIGWLQVYQVVEIA